MPYSPQPTKLTGSRPGLVPLLRQQRSCPGPFAALLLLLLQLPPHVGGERLVAALSNGLQPQLRTNTTWSYKACATKALRTVAWSRPAQRSAARRRRWGIPSGARSSCAPAKYMHMHARLCAPSASAPAPQGCTTGRARGTVSQGHCPPTQPPAAASAGGCTPRGWQTRRGLRAQQQ